MASSTNGISAPPISSTTGGIGEKYKPRYIDIGINLTDSVYTGYYHGTPRHPSDLEAVVQRALSVGCSKLLITGSSLSESRKAIALSEQYPGVCYSTVGVHPCSCLQFSKGGTQSADIHLSQLRALAISAKASGHAVAFGEIGLDYDRLELCPKHVQVEFFEKQLEVAVEIGLPLFLHSRAAHRDFLEILGRYEEGLEKAIGKGKGRGKGVVHSFTGSKEEMLELVERGWDIGINGCSLKTAENCEVAALVPLDRLHLETDGPWCEIRNSHASNAVLKRLVQEGKVAEEELDGDGEKKWKWLKKEKWVEGGLIKSRNESCTIPKVAWALAGIKDVGIEVIVEAAWRNSVRMFGLGEVIEEEV